VSGSTLLQDVSCTLRQSRRSFAAVQPPSAMSLSLLSPGEFVSVVGPTGCGKSTLLNVAAGLLEPSSGAVRVFGEPPGGHQPPCRLHVPDEALMPWRSDAPTTCGRIAVPRPGGERCCSPGDDWLKRVGLTVLRRPLPAPALGGMRQAHVAARRPRARPGHHSDGRAVLCSGYPDAAADGENEFLELWAAKRKAVLFHHARPGRGDRA